MLRIYCSLYFWLSDGELFTKVSIRYQSQIKMADLFLSLQVAAPHFLSKHAALHHIQKKLHFLGRMWGLWDDLKNRLRLKLKLSQ